MPVNSKLFAWPAKRGPTSQVIKQVEGWQDEGILIPHEPLRWYHEQIKLILPKLEIGEDWRIRLFAKWFKDVYVFYVHHHHDAEEKIYNPGLAAHGAKIPPNIVTDHKSLIDGLNKIEEYLRQMLTDKNVIPAFTEFILKFFVEMEGHLADEEVNYPKQVRECGMTYEQELKIVGKIQRSGGLGMGKMMLPIILYNMCLWKGVDGMQEFTKHIPPPIRFLLKNRWLSHFYHNNLNVVQSLKGDAAPPVKSRGCVVM